jgi:CubicO group peptidase (beta-lactamase class C family)
MKAFWSRPPLFLAVVFASMAWTPVGAQGRLPSPAADAAEELLEVVRTGDRARIRGFVEGRFTAEFIAAFPLDDYHVPVLASFGRQIQGLEIASVTLSGPFATSMLLTGPGKRLEVRVAVEPGPPHRIIHVGWQNAGPEIKAQSLGDLGEELELLADVPPFSGVVLVARGGEVLFHEAYGSADIVTGRLNRLETRFDIGSLNKLFTSTAILRLAQDGRLALDDPVGKYLDGFRPEVAQRVTIRHLLAFRSGFDDYLSHPQFEADPKRFREPADFLPLAREQELRFEPGSRWHYSNMGFVLLGAIIERVTSRGYHRVIDDLVFGPARMESAGAIGGAEAARRYELRDGRFESTDGLYPEVGSPAGGGFASAMDLHRFVEALLAHGLLNEPSTALLLNNFEAQAGGGILPEEVGYSGGAPGVNAVFLVLPAERQTVIVLGNIGPVAVDAIARRVKEILD